MKNFNYLTILLATCILFTFSACKKWLEVQPEDKFTEQQIFNTPGGIASSLNGVYLDISKAKLYGANLTSTTLEIFAQRYNVYASHDLHQYQLYNFGDTKVIATLDNIWSSAYINVVNLNQFVANLDKYKGVLDAKTDSLFRGEAIAMRAYLHFDLLRMFGPRYSTADSTMLAIPYYNTASTTANPILPANTVMNNILADLSTAEKLLASDPIISKGVLNTAENTWLTNRNYRMNYFALKGLQARAYLYRGDKVSALAAAKIVIDQSAKFPWITPANILSEKSNPNRVFSTELLFGSQSLDLYGVNRDYFAPDLVDWKILVPLDARLKTFFESNDNDYRYNPNWILAATGKSYKTFYKYTDVVDKTKTFRYTVPLIRLSEMYYIAAECEPVVATAFNYINTVRNNRGLVNLATTVNLTTELQKEYQKEFFGEGQLFFYYKRRNVTTIPNATASTGNVTMNAAKYVFPLPLSETTPR